uniref:Putative secreted protein n=1 Tax=Anopheles darlingi TaxID=43151 RepID=A0A2M4D831_ANODA
MVSLFSFRIPLLLLLLHLLNQHPSSNPHPCSLVNSTLARAKPKKAKPKRRLSDFIGFFAPKNPINIYTREKRFWCITVLPYPSPPYGSLAVPYASPYRSKRRKDNDRLQASMFK